MFQQIDPYVFDNHYEQLTASEEDLALLVHDHMALVSEKDGGICLPLCRDVKATEWDYLFSVSGKRFFLARNASETVLQKGRWLGYRDLFGKYPTWLSYAVMVGIQIGAWYDDNRFCGRCGVQMERSQTERAVRCPSCGKTVYPRINPVIIVAVRDGEDLLLTKYRSGYDRYALVAGFAEVGETIEDTVRREVFEETGVRVKNITFFGSQPWPHSESLLLGFYCDLDGDPSVHVQESELSEAVWKNRKEVPAQEHTLSLTSTLIEAFRTGEI